MIRSVRHLLASLLAVALSGCSTFQVMNSVQPRGGVSVTRDIVYADGARGRLDVHAPPRTAAGRPVVVFFYGGNWEGGTKDDYAWVGAALARQGYVTILPDYRIHPEVAWPAFVQDSAKAVRWARDHAAEYGGDPDELVLMGHSAGAYNAVALAVDRRWLAAEGLDPRRDVKAVVGLSGPYDFLPLESDVLKTIFGPEAARPDTQPITHVDGQAPPMLLVTGDDDTIVLPGNSDRMAARVREKGGEAAVIRYPKTGHAHVVAALSGQLRWLAPVMRDVRRFVDEKTGFRR